MKSIRFISLVLIIMIALIPLTMIGNSDGMPPDPDNTIVTPLDSETQTTMDTGLLAGILSIVVVLGSMVLSKYFKGIKKQKWNTIYPMLERLTGTIFVNAHDPDCDKSTARERLRRAFNEEVKDLTPKEVAFLADKGIQSGQDLYNKITAPGKKKGFNGSDFLGGIVNGLGDAAKDMIPAIATGFIGNLLKK